MRFIRGFSLLVIKRSLRTVRTGPRGTITTKLQGLLTNELIEESMRLEEEIDIELIDIRERINKYYTVEDNNGFVKLTSKYHELHESNKPRVEIMWHIQVSNNYIHITTRTVALYLILTIYYTCDYQNNEDIEADRLEYYGGDRAKFSASAAASSSPYKPTILASFDADIGIHFTINIAPPSSTITDGTTTSSTSNNNTTANKYNKYTIIDCFASEKLHIFKIRLNSLPLLQLDKSCIWSPVLFRQSKLDKSQNYDLLVKTKNSTSTNTNNTSSNNINDTSNCTNTNNDSSSISYYPKYKYNQLASSTRNNIRNILKSLYINDDITYFILAYSRYREQQLYVQWLERVCLYLEPGSGRGPMPGKGEKKEPVKGTGTKPEKKIDLSFLDTK